MQYMVVDLEGTCCNDDSIPPDERETIEIGAVVVDSCGWKSVATFERLIRPVRYPVLTEFCTVLTGITQGDVDGAESFVCVWEKFCRWRVAFKEPVFCSWGLYDKMQFRRDCEYHKCIGLIGQHVNLARVYQKKYRGKRGHRGAMKRLGIKPSGAHHRGLSDAVNIAKMLPFLFG